MGCRGISDMNNNMFSFITMISGCQGWCCPLPSGHLSLLNAEGSLVWGFFVMLGDMRKQKYRLKCQVTTWPYNWMIILELIDVMVLSKCNYLIVWDGIDCSSFLLVHPLPWQEQKQQTTFKPVVNAIFCPLSWECCKDSGSGLQQHWSDKYPSSLQSESQRCR